MTDVVLYSAIYGDSYDSPKDVSNVEAWCILYTDNEHLYAPGWEVRHREVSHLNTPMLRAKHWKTHPLEATDGAGVSIWIDGSMTPRPRFVEHCMDALGTHDWALTPHPWRDCIYEELEASVHLPKYEPGPMRRQVDGYRLEGHPEHWGLFATGAMTRRHTENVLLANRDWWLENWFKSWQDQLSLPVVLRKYTSIDWATTMPWAAWWDIAEHGT